MPLGVRPEAGQRRCRWCSLGFREKRARCRIVVLTAIRPGDEAPVGGVREAQGTAKAAFEGSRRRRMPSDSGGDQGDETAGQGQEP